MREKTTLELRRTSNFADSRPPVHPQRASGKQATQPLRLRWHGAQVSGFQASAPWSPEVIPASSADINKCLPHDGIWGCWASLGTGKHTTGLWSTALLLRVREPHSPGPEWGTCPNRRGQGGIQATGAALRLPAIRWALPFPGRSSRLDEPGTIACSVTSNRVQRGQRGQEPQIPEKGCT